METAFAHFQTFFRHYGLLAVFAVLLLENFGLPLPGEIALLYAGYSSRAHGFFSLLELAVVASLGCFLGQAGGYGIGRFASPWAQRWMHLGGRRQARLEAYFRRHGPWTIVFSRFIAVLRVFAGIAAGLYHMPWRRFLLFNAIGAVAWTVALSQIGALLGAHWHRLLRLASRADLIILLVAAVAIVIAWRALHPEEGEPHVHP